MEGRKRVEFYHTAAWTKASRNYRAAHPFCAICEKEGILTQAQVVDHIIPLEICTDPWDENNWQPLCHRHHNKKAAQDKLLIQKHKNHDL